MNREDAIAEIRAALKRRSGKTWSVTGGRGSAWGWIRIHVPPRRRVEFGYMSEEDRRELGSLLGLDRPVHQQGESVPSSDAYYQEYIDRANGRKPTVYGRPYWD